MILDASKAFDRVHYVKLFRLLSDKALCPLMCRLLYYLYTQQTVSVRWGGKTVKISWLNKVLWKLNQSNNPTG